MYNDLVHVDILHFISGLSTEQGAGPIIFSPPTGKGLPKTARMDSPAESMKKFCNRLFDTREAILKTVMESDNEATTTTSQTCVQTHLLGKARTQAHHEAIDWSSINLERIQAQQKKSLSKTFINASTTDNTNYQVLSYEEHSVEEKTPKPLNENDVKAAAVLRVLSKKMTQKISIFKEFFSNTAQKEQKAANRCLAIQSPGRKTTEQERIQLEKIEAQLKYDQQPVQAYTKIQEQIEKIKEDKDQLAKVFDYIQSSDYDTHAENERKQNNVCPIDLDTQVFSEPLTCLSQHYSPFWPRNNESRTLLQYLKKELRDSYSYVFDESRVVAAWVTAKLGEFKQNSQVSVPKYFLYIAYPETLEDCITCPAKQAFATFLKDNPSFEEKIELKFTATNDHIVRHKELLGAARSRRLASIYEVLSGFSSSSPSTSPEQSPRSSYEQSPLSSYEQSLLSSPEISPLSSPEISPPSTPPRKKAWGSSPPREWRRPIEATHVSQEVKKTDPKEKSVNLPGSTEEIPGCIIF